MASLQLQHSWLPCLTNKKPTSHFPSKPSHFKLSLSLTPPGAGSPQPTSQNPRIPTPEPDPGPVDPVKLAFERAKAYKKSVEERKSLELEGNPVGASGGGDEGDKAVPVSVKVAMEKAKEYKKNKGFGVDGGGVKGVAESGIDSGPMGENRGNLGTGMMDKSSSKKEKLSISSLDFKGLDFADKKQGRGLPAGLVPITDPFPAGDLPEVEIIVGDTSNFGDTRTPMPKPPQEDDSDIYKPKVSTWGVFPRPGNISKTFGGGKTIRPGDVLETAEERAAKDEHTRQLLAAYRKKIGLSIDAKLKIECEKALKDGDSLLDSGQLEEALPYYEKIMDKLVFQSELHGLAALQWSICQDSLRRSNEARAMYEKLQSHPNPKVSKRATQFMFSFKAMEMMKVRGSNISPESTGYKSYFEAFVEDKNNFPVVEAVIEEGELSRVIPYLIFLASPIIIVLFMAVQRGNVN